MDQEKQIVQQNTTSVWGGCFLEFNQNKELKLYNENGQTINTIGSYSGRIK